MSGIINSAGSRSGVIGTTELDYEEGTWEVALTTSGGGTISVNASYNTCTYIRVGNLVSCGGMIATDGVTVGSTGTLQFSLPFAVASGSEWERYFAGSCYFRLVSLATDKWGPIAPSAIPAWAIVRSSPGSGVCQFTGTKDDVAYVDLQDDAIASGDRIGIGLQ